MSAMIRTCVTSFVLIFTGVALAGCDDGGKFAFSNGAFWPPRVGKAFPEVVFTNYDGRKIRISDFKGKVVLVEPIGMNCAACLAFAGGNEVGGIGRFKPQRGVRDIKDYLDTYGDGMSLDNGDVVLVQVLLYDLNMGAPDMDDARLWAKHFRADANPNIYVVFSEKDLRGRASYNLVPGFQLIDKKSVVRFDATGHRPRHRLHSQLLAAVPRLVRN